MAELLKSDSCGPVRWLAVPIIKTFLTSKANFSEGYLIIVSMMLEGAEASGPARYTHEMAPHQALGPLEPITTGSGPNSTQKTSLMCENYPHLSRHHVTPEMFSQCPTRV
jgi:hypothetical protein